MFLEILHTAILQFVVQVEQFRVSSRCQSLFLTATSSLTEMYPNSVEYEYRSHGKERRGGCAMDRDVPLISLVSPPCDRRPTDP